MENYLTQNAIRVQNCHQSRQYNDRLYVLRSWRNYTTISLFIKRYNIRKYQSRLLWKKEPKGIWTHQFPRQYNLSCPWANHFATYLSWPDIIATSQFQSWTHKRSFQWKDLSIWIFLIYFKESHIPFSIARFILMCYQCSREELASLSQKSLSIHLVK